MVPEEEIVTSDDDVVMSDDETELDEEDEIDLEEDDEDDADEEFGGAENMYAFGGILRGTFHMPPEEDDEEDDSKNICEVLDDGMNRLCKTIATQNKILLKILTSLSNK